MGPVLYMTVSLIRETEAKQIITSVFLVFSVFLLDLNSYNFSTYIYKTVDKWDAVQ